MDSLRTVFTRLRLLPVKQTAVVEAMQPHGKNIYRDPRTA